MGNSDRFTWLINTQQPQEQRYPFLSVCAVFPCVRTVVWLPVFGIFNVHTDVDACDCTRGLYGHRERVCTESWPWEKNPLPHDSNPRQYCGAWCFSRTLYQLNYPCPCRGIEIGCVSAFSYMLVSWNFQQDTRSYTPRLLEQGTMKPSLRFKTATITLKLKQPIQHRHTLVPITDNAVYE